MPDTIEISVVIPLVETRGRALDSISSWAREQTLARERYEVLVVGDGAFRRQAEERLGANGRFIESAERHATALYNVGAREARAPLLFITEAHCLGDRHCLERVLAFIRDRGLDGAFCASDGLPGNLFAQMEQRLFESEVERRKAAGSNVISVRGTAISKARFLEAGGFADRYGHFAELLLGDALQAQGARMASTDDALVFHENIDNAPELIAALREYGRDECRVAADGGSFSRRCRVWEQRAAWTKPVARARLSALLRAAPCLVKTPRDAAIFARLFAELAAPAAAGIEGRLFASHARLRWLGVRLALGRGPSESCFRRYSDLWDSAIRHGSYEFLADQASAIGVSHEPYDLSRHDERLIGFHEPERSDCGPFRWSEPVALVQVAAEPGDYEISLSLHRSRADAVASLAAFFDGNRIRELRKLEHPQRVVFSIPRVLVASRPTHHLVFVCRPCPVDRRKDARALGLPVAGIEITATSGR